MKVGDIVIAPKGCSRYLTPKKEYIVDRLIQYGYFAITDDDGDDLYTCREKECVHLYGLNWILKPTSHDSPQDNKTIKK